MSEVKRYESGVHYCSGDAMVREDDGYYVKYSDYANLKAERDALAAKGMELCREAARVYEKYNVTQMPDMDLVDCQTIQEFSDLAGGSITTDAYANQLRAEGVEMFAKYIALYNSNAKSHADEFAANLRKENGNG